MLVWTTTTALRTTMKTQWRNKYFPFLPEKLVVGFCCADPIEVLHFCTLYYTLILSYKGITIFHFVKDKVNSLTYNCTLLSEARLVDRQHSVTIEASNDTKNTGRSRSGRQLCVKCSYEFKISRLNPGRACDTDKRQTSRHDRSSTGSHRFR